MPDPRIEDLERAAALHWQAPETEPLGEWRLRAADGFTGRANSALPLGDPGLPLPEAVTAVEEWYRRRALPPMIVVPKVLLQGTPDPLEDLLAERGWVPRPGPAFVMTADVADIPACRTDVQLDQEPDACWLALYRYRGQDLPPPRPRPRRAPRPASGRDGQRPGPRALLPVRVPRLPSLPLHDCAPCQLAPGRHMPYVLWVITGSRYVCKYGDPCP